MTTADHVPGVSGPVSKIFGLVMYLISQGAVLIWALFLCDVGLFKINHGSMVAPSIAWLTNIGLILLFGAQHSMMARAGFKNIVTRLIPAHLERSTFVGISGLALLAMTVLWQPLPEVVYRADGIVRNAVWVGYGIGWVLVVVSTMLIDNKALHGLRQSFTGNPAESSDELLTPSLYKLVRHPMMLGFLIVIWATPDMTEGRLLLAATMTVYLFVGMHLEEKALVSHFGKIYDEYKNKVPMILPWPR